MILYSKMGTNCEKQKHKIAGRAQWNDPGPVFPPHQLAFDKAERHVSET